MALKDWQLQFLEQEAALGKDYGKLQSAMGWGGMAGGLTPEDEPTEGATPIPEDHPARTPAYQHPDVILPGYKPWEDFSGYKFPEGSGYDSTPPSGGGGVGGGGPVVQDWQKTATEPWGGTIQFTPGGAVYRKPEGWTYEQMQANQDVLMREGYYLNPEQFGQHMGIDIYEPGYVPGTYSPTQGVDPAFSQVAWDAVDQYPNQRAFQEAVYAEQDRRLKQAMIDQMAADMYGGGGFGGGAFGGGAFGGGFGGGYSYDPYTGLPTGGGIPPVTETSTYPTTPTFTGEPSFAKDTDLSDPFLNIREVGLGAFPTQTMRDRLGTWLTKEMGYDPQGVYGSYGEQEYERPSGTTGPIWFNPSDFMSIVDPQIQSWIKWLMGRMGYAATANYPGAVAP